MIERVAAGRESLFVSQIVLCELVWVLSYAYRFKREGVVGALQLLRARLRRSPRVRATFPII